MTVGLQRYYGCVRCLGLCCLFCVVFAVLLAVFGVFRLLVYYVWLVGFMWDWEC